MLIVFLALSRFLLNINLLLKIVDEDPKEFGYEFGRWTAARLAEHLEKVTGIKLSGSQVRRILRRKKYRRRYSPRNSLKKGRKSPPIGLKVKII